MAYAQQGGTFYYVVKSGDTLSHILQAYDIVPLWGKHGSVKKVYSLNRANIRNEDLVVPGNIIILPHRAIASESQGPSILRVEEIAPTNPPSPPTEIPKAPAPASKPIPPLLARVPIENSDDDLPVSHIEFFAGSGYSRIDSKNSANGSQATLLSKAITEFSLRWEQHWSEDIHSFIAWSYGRFPFRSANVGQLNSDTQESTSLYIGGNFQLSPKWKLEAMGGMKDFYFVPSYLAGTATLETKSLPTAEIRIIRQVAKIRSLALYASLGASWIGSSSDGSYTIQSGSSYFGSLRVEQKFTKHGIFAEMKYEDLSQATSQFQIKRKDIFGRFGFSWDL